MAKTIIFDAEAKKKLKEGIDILANAVKITLGPSGRNVVINRQHGTPHVTKDGVTVANSIYLKDPIQNMGAQMIKEVSQQTAHSAGDGTTTATVLAQAMINEGMKYSMDGSINITDLKNGMDMASKCAIEFIKKSSKILDVTSTDMLKQISVISSNSDECIGELVSDAYIKIGVNGVITVTESNGIDSTIELIDGLQFDRGYISPYFSTDGEKMITEYKDVYALITDKTISSTNEIIPVIEEVIKSGRPFLIIAENVDGEALSSLVVNKMNGVLKVVAVKAPGYGTLRKELLTDICTVTGATLVTDDVGVKLRNVSISMLGTINSLIITKEKTTIIGGGGSSEDIRSRAIQLKSQIDEATQQHEKDKLKERLAKLVGGVAVIKIGAATEVEMKEKKDRVDDALHATRAALEEGVIPGGGTIFIKAMTYLTENHPAMNTDMRIGYEIVCKSLSSPLMQIAKNSGHSGEVVFDKVSSTEINYGFDARKGKYGDMLSFGVIDPSKVARLALQNATSVAGMVLTTECIISDEPEPYKGNNDTQIHNDY